MKSNYTTEQFIKDAKNIHGDRYDYSQSIYTGHSKNVTINCIEHGSFEQSVYRHLKGKGCIKCGYISMAAKIKRKHNKEHDIFIIKNYTTRGAAFCAKHINQSTRYVYLRALQLNVRKNSPKLRHKFVPGRLWSNMNSNAKRRNLHIDITPDDIYEQYIKQNKKCALTGRVIVLSSNPTQNTASVDRIDSAYGYIKNNIQLVIAAANQAKMDLSTQAFFELCKDVYLTCRVPNELQVI